MKGKFGGGVKGHKRVGQEEGGRGIEAKTDLCGQFDKCDSHQDQSRSQNKILN